MALSSIGIIPARYASTRFPGKPLADIKGKSMIRRVYEQASQSELNEVLVATDDQRIVEHVRQFGGNVVLTSTDHASGTDRCFEAYTANNRPFDLIVNVQGDEPFIHPEQINAVIKELQTPEAQISTLVRTITKTEDLFSPNAVKAVLGNHHQALYFSRHPVPYFRGVEAVDWVKKHTYYHHLGIYGFTAPVLEQLVQLPVSELEHCESLEQLRWLENGYRINVGITEYTSFGVDTPDDLLRALEIVASA